MTFYIQNLKGRLYSDIIMFCKNSFLAITHHLNSETEAETFGQILN